MKKLILIIALALVTISAVAQEKPKPVRKATIKLEIQEGDKDLLLFALTNAPLMKTTLPANQVEPLMAKLKEWAISVNEQLVKQFPIDTAKSKKN